MKFILKIYITNFVKSLTQLNPAVSLHQKFKIYRNQIVTLNRLYKED